MSGDTPKGFKLTTLDTFSKYAVSAGWLILYIFISSAVIACILSAVSIRIYFFVYKRLKAHKNVTPPIADESILKSVDENVEAQGDAWKISKANQTDKSAAEKVKEQSRKKVRKEKAKEDEKMKRRRREMLDDAEEYYRNNKGCKSDLEILIRQRKRMQKRAKSKKITSRNIIKTLSCLLCSQASY